MARNPYTNFHDLNLNWIIEKIKTVFTPDNPPPYPVTSVNQKTGAVNLKGTDIPVSANDPQNIAAALSAKYVKPSGGIPASDIAPGVIPDPTSIIDDNAGYQGYDKTWSAHKLFQQEADILDLQIDKQDAPASSGTAGQVLGLNASLQPEWVDMPEAQIIEALDDWLSENITNPSNPPLDRSLSLANACAPADLVGDLKSALAYLSEPTANLLNILTADVTNFFPNGSTQKLATALTVKSVIIPVDSEQGTSVYIYKGINSRFSITTLASTNPASGDSYISNSYKAGTDTEATVTIDSTVKAILIWYYDTSYQSDASKDPTEILESITVLYGTAGQPVRSIIPYGLYNIDKPNLTNNTTDEFTTVPLSQYNTTNKAGTSLYINDKVFSAGFINKATVRNNGDSSGTFNILFIHPITHSILRWYSGAGTGVFDIAINEYMPVDFLLGVQGENSTFKASNYSVYGINWKDIGINTFNTLKCGDVINFSFPERAESATCYYLGCDLQYASMKGFIYRPENIYTHNKMFAVGDSITAGYIHYTEGIHWWETVGRALGYEVTPGAQSGAGISYFTSGKNACKYAHDVDFAPYNVAVFAFGTNDYGNDIPIGTFEDQYTYSEDSSQTFYACLKYIIETVKTKNPKCTLIFSLPINRIRGTIDNRYAYGYQNGVGKTLNDYCEAIVYCCNYYGVPYLDHRKGAFDLYSLSTLLEDGLHPTDDGYKILGQEMTALISAIKQPYAEYSGVGGWIHG